MSRNGKNPPLTDDRSPNTKLYDDCLELFLKGTTVRRLQDDMGLQREQTLQLLKKIKSHFANERESRTDQLLCTAMRIAQALADEAEGASVEIRRELSKDIDDWISKFDVLSNNLDGYRRSKRDMGGRAWGQKKQGTRGRAEPDEAAVPFESL